MSFQPITAGRPKFPQDPFSPILVDGPAAGWRTVIPVRLSLLDAFPHHPFHVADDEAMGLLVDSIREQGVRDPILARRLAGGRYQIVSGHRRCHAARRAGLESVPCLVVDVDDDEATILMVDANLQRPNLTVSERAVSLRQKYEAMKHQGAHAGQGSSRRLLARTDGTSEATIRRLVSIPAHLIPAEHRKDPSGWLIGLIASSREQGAA